MTTARRHPSTSGLERDRLADDPSAIAPASRTSTEAETLTRRIRARSNVVLSFASILGGLTVPALTLGCGWALT